MRVASRVTFLTIYLLAAVFVLQHPAVSLTVPVGLSGGEACADCEDEGECAKEGLSACCGIVSSAGAALVQKALPLANNTPFVSASLGEMTIPLQSLHFPIFRPPNGG